jgi:hypothetical protein
VNTEPIEQNAVKVSLELRLTFWQFVQTIALVLMLVL